MQEDKAAPAPAGKSPEFLAAGKNRSAKSDRDSAADTPDGGSVHHPDRKLLRSLCEEHRRKRETAGFDQYEVSSEWTRNAPGSAKKSHSLWRWKERVEREERTTLSAENLCSAVHRRKEKKCNSFLNQVRTKWSSLVYFLKDLRKNTH